MAYLLFILSVVTLNTLADGVSEFDVESFLLANKLRKSPTIYTPLVGDSHNSCNVSGNIGVCMFTYECVTAGGAPLGTCREDHLFGSCCFTPTLVNALTKVKVDGEGQLRPISYGVHDCGIRSKLFVRKGLIYNGQDAQFGEFPWIVSVRRVSVKPRTVHWCGGTLLNHEWILTAAHCFYKVTAANIIARLGDYDFKRRDKYFPYVERRIIENVPHPKYVKAKGGINPYDINLLRMEKPIRFQPHISPICLPGPQKLLPSQKAITTGWGRTETLKLSSVLKKIITPIFNKTTCETMYRTEGYSLTLGNKLFCAGYSKGELDACQGDSGGPLQVEGTDGRFFVAGIVSTGIGCGKPNFPGIYLRVSPFLHWILQTMSERR